MSGDAEQDYFADGIVEDIITALSKLPQLFVIARNSSFTFKGERRREAGGRELGVRYVLEGSVRKPANRVRITAQLIDAATGGHLWADRFDGDLDDIFDLQDQVATSVVGAIAPKLEQAEIERAKRKPTESLDAYDFFLRGMAAFHQFNKAANIEALAFFLRAIERDPNFAPAYGMAARCYLKPLDGSSWPRAYAGFHSCSTNSLDELVLGNGISGTSTLRNSHSGRHPSRKSNVRRRSAGISDCTSAIWFLKTCVACCLSEMRPLKT